MKFHALSLIAMFMVTANALTAPMNSMGDASGLVKRQNPVPEPTDEPKPSPTDDPTPVPKFTPTTLPVLALNPDPNPTEDPILRPTDDPTSVPKFTPTTLPVLASNSDPTPAPRRARGSRPTRLPKLGMFT
ncbi:hypothetical protein BASA81_016781 [Batrachochytrium salamandrivorans]|nr:hypothetical protein BASA81_016781 [Batrachochytrium salamandrivorans]